MKLIQTTLNNERGVSLLEVLTTMIILSVLAATAIPNFSGWKTNYEIRSETEKVHLDLLAARMMAIKNNNDVVVTFYPASHSYSILNDTNNNGVADSGETLRTVNLENQMKFGFYGSSIVDMDNNTVTETVKMGPSDTVTFDARGQADLSGVLFLIHEMDLNKDNDRLRGINIIQATGAAELWEYDIGLSPPWK